VNVLPPGSVAAQTSCQLKFEAVSLEHASRHLQEIAVYGYALVQARSAQFDRRLSG